MPGSPVIIIQELLEVLDGQTPPIPIELIFIENDRKDFARLEETLAFWIPKLPDGVTVTGTSRALPGPRAPAPAPERSCASDPKRPILALFDAEGFDIPLSLVRTIARNPSSEVMVTLLTAEFVRFAGKPNEKADACFGDTEWRKVAKAPPSEKNQFIVDEYEKRVKGAPFKHVHTFSDDIGDWLSVTPRLRDQPHYGLPGDEARAVERGRPGTRAAIPGYRADGISSGSASTRRRTSSPCRSFCGMDC